MTIQATTPAAEVRRFLMTWNEYQALPESLCGEYVDGALILTPAPDRLHQLAVQYLTIELNKSCQPGDVAVPGWGWKPAADLFIPDVLVTGPTDETKLFTGTPLLAVEVTSSNYSDGLVTKRAKYADAGLGDYWVVDRRDNTLRCHTLQHGLLVETTTHADTGTVTASYAGREVALDLSRLFSAATASLDFIRESME